MSHARVTAVIALAGILAVGCGGGSHDRVGGSVGRRVTVLTIASHESEADVREWAAAVQRRSRGSLRIEVESGWRGAEVDYERHTVADVRAGKVDLASIPARAYDTMGVRSMQAVLAPLLVDSYALQERVLGTGLPERMLAGIRRLGVVGVALLPGQLERLEGGGRPLLRPSDYRGVVIGVRPSRLAARSLRALGAVTTILAPGARMERVDYAEQSLSELVAHHYAFITVGTTVTLNETLWPRVASIVVNADTYGSLTPEQQQALRLAARDALGPITRRLEHDESQAVDVICRPPRGDPYIFMPIRATEADLAQMRRAIEPTYRRLDSPARVEARQIVALRRRVGTQPAFVCSGGRPRGFHPSTSAHALRVTGLLEETARTKWSGPVASNGLGPGQFLLEHRILLRDFPVRRYLKFRVRFSKGELRGCVHATTTPLPGGGWSWDGPGAIYQAPAALREFLGMSVRFGGVTTARRPTLLRGGFKTDTPTGLKCLPF